MSVIAELLVPAHEFELGRILEMSGDMTIALEEMVPLGELAVPIFSVRNDSDGEFEQTVRDHPSVTAVREVSAHDDQRFYALDWMAERDVVLEGVRKSEAHLLSAAGSDSTWEFELRFPDHEELTAFQEYCENAHVSVDVTHVYNPTKPGAGPWFGLTKVQRDTLVRAVEGGYYDIPRRISTQELADEFGVSDQAVTERLRRAIIQLVESTLAVEESTERGQESAELGED